MGVETIFHFVFLGFYANDLSHARLMRPVFYLDALHAFESSPECQ